MSTRLYILPFEVRVDAFGRRDRRPKYLGDFTPPPGEATTPYSGISYGEYDWGFVAVMMEDANHAVLAAKPDVVQIPVDVSTTLGQANRDTVRAFLESIALPGTWIQNNTTWREVIRMVAHFMEFASKFDVIRRIADPAAPALGTELVGNLSVQWQNIPPVTQAAYVVTADSFGYDSSFITPTTLVRAILKSTADAGSSKIMDFGLDQYNGGVPFEV